MPRRLALGALALSAAVIACNATVMEVSKEHPAHPDAPVPPPASASRVLAEDFDALEYEGVARAGAEHQHGHHGHHGHHGASAAPPADHGAGDAGPAGHAGHDHAVAP